MLERKSQIDFLLEEEIIHALKTLKTHTPGSQEHTKIVDTILKLKGMQTKSSVSKDTMAIIGANLMGILLIIKHEHVNVITSRAMNLLMKPR